MNEVNWDVSWDGDQEVVVVDAGDTCIHLPYEVLRDMIEALDDD